MDIPAETGEQPPTVPIIRRSLVVLAGLPGAGKSTQLANLDGAPEILVLDSEQVRQWLRATLPSTIPYRWYRPVVHTVHRARIGFHCAMSPKPVVAHEPSTRASTRAMLVLFGWVSSRQRVFLWLDAAPSEALAGQHERGRVIAVRSFRRHVRRAVRVRELLGSGRLPRGWHVAHRFGREHVLRGLRLRMRDE